jgi:hypothetical protein
MAGVQVETNMPKFQPRDLREYDDGTFDETFLGYTPEQIPAVVQNLQEKLNDHSVSNIHAFRFRSQTENLGTKVDMRVSDLHISKVIGVMRESGYTFMGRKRNMSDIYLFIFYTPLSGR